MLYIEQFESIYTSDWLLAKQKIITFAPKTAAISYE